MKKFFRLVLIVIFISIVFMIASFSFKNRDTVSEESNINKKEVEEYIADSDSIQVSSDPSQAISTSELEPELELEPEPEISSKTEKNKKMITAEENKDVLSDLKSSASNLIYKEDEESYYEYCFENDKIVAIYYYINFGNSDVAEYMLKSYTANAVKGLYSKAEIYKECAVKAKMSDYFIKNYSNYTKLKLKQEMNSLGKKMM